MLATSLNWSKSNTNSQISLEILPKTIEIVQSKAGKLDKEETGGLPYSLVTQFMTSSYDVIRS